MYLLENTGAHSAIFLLLICHELLFCFLNLSWIYYYVVEGDFVRANGLQEGDFIVIYSDVKCNKYVCLLALS